MKVFCLNNMYKLYCFSSVLSKYSDVILSSHIETIPDIIEQLLSLMPKHIE